MLSLAQRRISTTKLCRTAFVTRITASLPAVGFPYPVRPHSIRPHTLKYPRKNPYLRSLELHGNVNLGYEDSRPSSLPPFLCYNIVNPYLNYSIRSCLSAQPSSGPSISTTLVLPQTRIAPPLQLGPRHRRTRPPLQPMQRGGQRMPVPSAERGGWTGAAASTAEKGKGAMPDLPCWHL